MMEREKRPECTKCGARTSLARISPVELVDELRIFECVACGHTDRYVVRTGPQPYWVLLPNQAANGAPTASG